MNPLLTAALDYSARGWYVIPLHTPTGDGGCSCRGKPGCRPGKHPHFGWKDLPYADADTVRGWWKKWPNANVGILTGPSGLFVQDTDDEEAEAAYRDLNLPDTATVKTGGGGFHHYFMGEGKTSTGVIDTCGRGGLVVAPPSLHHSGTKYAWFSDLSPVPYPDQGEKKVGAETKKAAPTTKEIRDVLHRLSDDRRDDYDSWTQVGIAVHHITAGEGFALWDEWSKKSPKYENEYDAMEKKWSSFEARENGLGMGSLVMWANEDGGLPPDFPEITDLVWETTTAPGDPVTFSVTVGEHGRLKRLVADDLRLSYRFKSRCMDGLGIYIPTVSAKTWDSFMVRLFKTVKKEELPLEAGRYGTFIGYLTKYLDFIRPGIHDLKELVRSNPVAIDDRAYFGLPALQDQLALNRFFYKEGELHAWLERCGGKRHPQKKIDGRVIRYWSVPYPFNDQVTGQLPVPVIEDLHGNRGTF